MNVDSEKGVDAPEALKQVLSSSSPETGSIRNGAIETILNSSYVEDLQIAGLDPTFQAKADLVNHAIQAIGMGKYQWWLFVVTGFGWLVDQVSWKQLMILSHNSISNIYHRLWKPSRV